MFFHWSLKGVKWIIRIKLKRGRFLSVVVNRYYLKELSSVSLTQRVISTNMEWFSVLGIFFLTVVLCLVINLLFSMYHLYKRRKSEYQHRLLNVLYGHLAMTLQLGTFLNMVIILRCLLHLENEMLTVVVELCRTCQVLVGFLQSTLLGEWMWLDCQTVWLSDWPIAVQACAPSCTTSRWTGTWSSAHLSMLTGYFPWFSWLQPLLFSLAGLLATTGRIWTTTHVECWSSSHWDVTCSSSLTSPHSIFKLKWRLSDKTESASGWGPARWLLQQRRVSPSQPSLPHTNSRFLLVFEDF